MWCTAQRKGRPYACCPLANANDLLTPVLWTVAGGWVKTTVLFFAVCGPNIMSADAGEIVVCNAVFRFLISCSVLEIFAIEIAPKSMFWPHFFLGEDPQNLDVVFKIAPISDHVAVSRRSADRARRSRAEEKKRKKQQQNIRARAFRYRNGRP